jgi:hypothetical protein
VGGRCARCAASQRSIIVKQSFVAAQPWGTATRCARAASQRSNIVKLSFVAAQPGGTAARAQDVTDTLVSNFCCNHSSILPPCSNISFTFFSGNPRAKEYASVFSPIFRKRQNGFRMQGHDTCHHQSIFIQSSELFARVCSSFHVGCLYLSISLQFREHVSIDCLRCLIPYHGTKAEGRTETKQPSYRRNSQYHDTFVYLVHLFDALRRVRPAPSLTWVRPGGEPKKMQSNVEDSVNLGPYVSKAMRSDSNISSGA